MAHARVAVAEPIGDLGSNPTECNVIQARRRQLGGSLDRAPLLGDLSAAGLEGVEARLERGVIHLD
ncbi:MAG: hypothetical protein NBV67_08145 [Tagaea sp.]|nr:hypothetical protein [Tagaea sp.]